MKCPPITGFFTGKNRVDMNTGHKSGCFLLIALLMYSIAARAETCPAVSEIVERQISNLYIWTVEEGTTLDDLLSVNRLFSVRIHDHGRFVSCRYTAKKWPVKLDAMPEVNGCNVIQTDGDWKEIEAGELVCRDKNLFACKFRISCDTD